MVCIDLSLWKDFPKGLRVLLVDEDSNSAAEMKTKLEEMNYIVSLFSHEDDALSAVSSKPEHFHVAIVEVCESNIHRSCKFLEAAKDLPIIMISNTHCLSTMMKCIALGAVEFLQKPVSEEKLRSIWQHVVHKAFSAGGSVTSETLELAKNSVASVLQLRVETEPQHKLENLQETENAYLTYKTEHEDLPEGDKYPAPSTPQLKQGVRLMDDGDCQEQTNCSTEKDNEEQEGESKSVEMTCILDESAQLLQDSQSLTETKVNEEDDSADGVKSGCNTCTLPKDKDNFNSSDHATQNQTKSSSLENSGATRTNRKKMKIDWTAELHKKFVQAVEQLGADQAIPSRILELMKVEGLTRHNVASHLQKYRMHQRHILPKEDDRRWLNRRGQIQRTYNPPKPIMAYPPYYSYTHAPLYPLREANCYQPCSAPIWNSPAYLPWIQAQSWHWNFCPGTADAWGCPVMPPLYNHYSPLLQNAPECQNAGTVDNGLNMPQNSFDLHPAEEVIDKVVKEAISKPWLPLPLGLKPPSTDGVLSELTKQGIFAIPPYDHHNHHRGSGPL